MARFRGTVIFAVVNGKPHLRVFANQDMDELKRGSDFVAPQSVQQGPEFWGPSSPGHPAFLGLQGTVKIRHSVDGRGKTTGVQVVSESRAGEGFGQEAVEHVSKSVYLPAYRNGKPAASTLTYEVTFFPNR
jgi:TonB family protein